MSIIEIDGSVEEGGGQILRIALALSSIMNKPFILRDIRAKRQKPGLQPQHLMCVKAAEQITGGRAIGATLGSTELEFYPKTIIGGRYDFDIGTAGSVTLLLQTIIPILLYSDRPSQLKVAGGTHVTHSPTIDYYEHVFIPLVEKFNLSMSMKVDTFGWFPKGGGSVAISIKPSPLIGIKLLDKGSLVAIRGTCALSNLPDNILAREEEGIRSVFSGADVEKTVKQSRSEGTAVTVWAEFENSTIGASALGKKGLRAEQLGKDVTLELKEKMEHTGAVDEWMSDQLLIFMSLSAGVSSISVPKITSHAKTCMRIIPMFTNIPFKIDDNIISVKGIK